VIEEEKNVIGMDDPHFLIYLEN
jgi:hypothetical protein